jgi:hypothetical protein
VTGPAQGEMGAPFGSRHATVGVPSVNGYRLLVVCGCGTEFKRWVTLNDADEGLLKSALVAFGN